MSALKLFRYLTTFSTRSRSALVSCSLHIPACHIAHSRYRFMVTEPQDAGVLPMLEETLEQINEQLELSRAGEIIGRAVLQF